MDVYAYEKPQPNGEYRLVEVPLDEEDDLWLQLRHSHIADVSNMIPRAIKQFSADKKINGLDKENITMRELSQVMKKMPQYQKEMAKYELHFNIAETAMNNYNGGVEELCKIEQNLATGTDSEYAKIKDPMIYFSLGDGLNFLKKFQFYRKMFQEGIDPSFAERRCQ